MTRLPTSGAQNDIQHFANSSKGEVATNKDGSVTRSSSSTRGQTTRTQALTTDQGPLGNRAQSQKVTNVTTQGNTTVTRTTEQSRAIQREAPADNAMVAQARKLESNLREAATRH